MKPVIEVKNLVKNYKKSTTPAVDDISFEVAEGEFFAFLGPNGAGKTTTISILTTILAKTSGQVKIAGFDVDSQQKQVRNSIGVIFQKPSLDENLTAEENIRFHAVLYGVYSFSPTFSAMPKAYQKSVNDLAEVLGIQKELFQPIKTYSGGMKRKLEIVRSLIHTPKVLFLDEPTSGLDPLSRRNLWDYLTTVRNSNQTTIFLTTHYLEEAEGADKVCIINKGQIVSFGTPQKIKSDLIEEYLTLDTKERSKLLDKLKSMKLKTEGQGPFKVYIKKDQAQKVISKINLPLTVLDIHTPSLEDAYLEAIQDEQRD